MVEVETEKYEITGLVDIFDEQNNITGQYPIGSIQELPVDKGAAAVEAGTAKLVEEEEASDESDADESEDETDEDATGETGEGEVE